MARLIFSSPEQSPLSHLYIVDGSVGKHGLNHRVDVLLVQFFLVALSPVSSIGGQPLPLDGICGPQTILAIKAFQLSSAPLREAATRGGTAGITDGTSNTILLGEQPPANAEPHVQRHYGTVEAAQHGRLEAAMTIVQLNLAYLSTFGEARFKRLNLHARLPRELSDAFYREVTGALHIREAAARNATQNNLRQLGP